MLRKLASRMWPMPLRSRKVPLLFKVQAAALVVALTTSFVVSSIAQTAEFQQVDFAVPFSQSKPLWQTEVEAFAQRMQLVFGVRSDVAAEFSGWILEAATRQDLAPELLASLVFTESSFRKHVVSHVGAMGPAQVRPYWQSFCGSPGLEDPAENIYCGAQILSYFKESCGEAKCALLAYNLGPRGMTLEQFASAGTRYVNRIDGHMERFDAAL